MAQGVLPFKYEEDKNDAAMTALGGLPVYLDLVRVIGLSQSIKKHLKIRQGSQGWTDSQIVIALVLLNIAGGSSVDDLNVLEGDRGFCDVLNKIELHGLHRKVRRALEKRWRKEKRRTVPSPSAVFLYLSTFHDTESGNSSQGQATIPELNEYLKGLMNINMEIKGKRYKVFAIVTNMKESGEEVIRWLHQRCGKNEEAHGVMKDDLSGGKLPSGDFGENAAWWWIMMVSLNLNGINEEVNFRRFLGKEKDESHSFFTHKYSRSID